MSKNRIKLLRAGEQLYIEELAKGSWLEVYRGYSFSYSWRRFIEREGKVCQSSEFQEGRGASIIIEHGTLQVAWVSEGLEVEVREMLKPGFSYLVSATEISPVLL